MIYLKTVYVTVIYARLGSKNQTYQPTNRHVSYFTNSVVKYVLKGLLLKVIWIHILKMYMQVFQKFHKKCLHLFQVKLLAHNCNADSAEGLLMIEAI